MPYVPPAMRKRGLEPKKIVTVVKKHVKETKVSKQQLMEEVRMEDYGKADQAYSSSTKLMTQSATT